MDHEQRCGARRDGAHLAAVSLPIARVALCELANQQRRFTQAVPAGALQQVDHRLQHTLLQHDSLDLWAGVHQVAKGPDRLVVRLVILQRCT
jgi:hypothetical protein